MRLVKVIKQLKANKLGESLVETLVALLIVVLAVTMLSGSIVSAAKINKASSEINDEFNTNGADVVNSSLSIKVTTKDGNNQEYSSEKTVKEYKTEAGYYYYDVN